MRDNPNSREKSLGMGAACYMGPGDSYEEMLADVRRHFLDRRKMPLEKPSKVRMIGILFARPSSAFTKAEIVPSYRYFHHRSGNHMNFYCAGFDPLWDIDQLADDDFLDFFSDRAFNQFRREIEIRSKWLYSGGADLLLTNARLRDDEAEIDFSTTISADLVKMKADGVILAVDNFVERIIQYSETQSGHDPTWGFSDSLGLTVGQSALKSLILSFLPQGLQADAKKAFHYVASDLSL